MHKINFISAVFNLFQRKNYSISIQKQPLKMYTFNIQISEMFVIVITCQETIFPLLFTLHVAFTVKNICEFI